jgi:hypothetical protein
MQLEDIMLYKVSQFRNIKSACFPSYVEIRSKRQIYTKKQTWSYANIHIERICNSKGTLWPSGNEGKEKITTEHQQGRGYKDMYWKLLKIGLGSNK